MRITCPECETVLKPANPIAVGKRVKCPRCGTTFPVTDEDAEPAPAKARAGAVKKAGDAAKPGKQPAPTGGDDDDEGGTYALAGGEGHGTGDEDDGAPEIDYAPDTSIKDLRGPAQAAVIQPTNMMIAAGVSGFLGWLACLIVFTIPVLFPIELDEGSKDAQKPILIIQRGLGGVGDEVFAGAGQTNKPPGTDKPTVSFYQFMGNDLSNVAMYAWYMFILMMCPILLGMAYTSLQTYGAVRAQNLESRQWGIAASIMGMLPISVGGLALFICMIASFVLNMLLDDDDTINYIVYGVSAILALLQIAAAVYTLMTLVRPEVIDGFEFVPDMENINPKKKDKPRRKKRR